METSPRVIEYATPQKHSGPRWARASFYHGLVCVEIIFVSLFCFPGYLPVDWWLWMRLCVAACTTCTLASFGIAYGIRGLPRDAWTASAGLFLNTLCLVPAAFVAAEHLGELWRAILYDGGFLYFSNR